MTANDGGGNRRFVYDETNIVGEQDISAGSFISSYDYGYGGLGRQSRGTAISYYQFDGLGSTRKLTDPNQVVTDTTSYDAWGNVLSATGTTTNRFRFVGRHGYYGDSDSSMLLLGVRHCNAGVGRFWSVDPARDGLNFYIYTYNTPVNAIDPTGQAIIVPVAFIIMVGLVGAWQQIEGEPTHTTRMDCYAGAFAMVCASAAYLGGPLTRIMLARGASWYLSRAANIRAFCRSMTLLCIVYCTWVFLPVRGGYGINDPQAAEKCLKSCSMLSSICLSFVP